MSATLLVAAMLLSEPRKPFKPPIESPVPKVSPEAISIGKSPRNWNTPRFYDRRGRIELGIEVGLASFDMAQTCHNLATGGREYLLPTQNCAAAIGMTAGFIVTGEIVAYVLHKKNQHFLEQFGRVYLAGASVRGIAYSKKHGAW